MDEATTPGADDSRRSRPDDEPGEPAASLFPAYSVVLLLTALFSLLVASRGASAWHELRSGGALPAEARREIVFSLVFTGAVAAALLLAWLGEWLAAALRLARGATAARVLLRLLLTLLPLACFGLGQRLVNPWLFELARQGRELVGGPGG